MRFRALYIREQERYTQTELCDLLGCPEDKAITIIRKLKEYGVLKSVKASELQRDMTDLLTEDIEVVDVESGEDGYLYVFTYVGIIVISGWVIKCYPKYIRNGKKPDFELAQVIKVLEKYNAKEQIIKIFNDSSENTSFNLLAVLLFLLQDYYDNGLYNNTDDVIETNGSGEILWDRTINDTFTLFSNRRPYYTELQTKKRVTDDYDFFTRLHRTILTKAAGELKEAGLLELFEIPELDLTDEELDEYGDKDYILYRIEKELNVQFSTRKQIVLKTLYAYIENNGSLDDIECFSLFGTNSFNLVWERVCADIMDNQLQVKIGSLSLPVPLRSGYDKNIKLIDLIERPLWTITGKIATDTLVPDLITIFRRADKYSFIIFDAKYYTAQLEEGKIPKGQPGIESVTKQYLYQLSYQKFISDHEFSNVSNCFLMPTEEDDVIDKGSVSMEMLSGLGLQDIKVRLLPAVVAYKHYLSGKHLDIKMLKL